MNKTVIDYSTLSSCLQKGISFAAYSLPGESEFTFIAQKNQAKEIDLVNNLKSGFIIHPFKANSKHPILFIKNEFFFREGEESEDLRKFIYSKKNYLSPSYSEISEQSKTDYLKLFNQFKHALDKGDLKKLVLSRVKNVHVDNSFDIVSLFKKLNQKHLHSFNYLLFTPQSGIWLGASPEILLKIDNEKAKTIALAGTQKRNNSSNYIWKEKEVEEQKFVIDYIQQILEKQIPKSQIEMTNETIEAGKMAHLRTNFSFPSKYVKDLVGFLKDLHPTPAVCGLPKKEAKQFIVQNEAHNRAYYSGFLGPVNMNNKTHLFVNLRCLKMESKILSLFLGGGLTKDSIVEKEWEETELKATTLESLL